jgi:hypothetical protein
MSSAGLDALSCTGVGFAGAFGAFAVLFTGLDAARRAGEATGEAGSLGAGAAGDAAGVVLRLRVAVGAFDLGAEAVEAAGAALRRDRTRVPVGDGAGSAVSAGLGVLRRGFGDGKSEDEGRFFGINRSVERRSVRPKTLSLPRGVA